MHCTLQPSSPHIHRRGGSLAGRRRVVTTLKMTWIHNSTPLFHEVSRDGSPRTLTIGAWALSQGRHTLPQVDGLLDGHDLDGAYRVLFRHFNCLLDGYRWQPLLDAVDDAALDALFERLCHAVFGTSCASTSAAATD